jgi:zinc transport system permease protein
MNWAILTDPLFRLPFATGLVLAAGLPLLGLYLRLRGDWLAVLGIGQLAGCGALVASLFGLPGLLGGLLAGAGAVWLRGGHADAAVHVLMLLAGWALTLLVLANHPAAEPVGQALFDGQLYFSGPSHAFAALLAGLAGVAVLARGGRVLLLARVHPALGAGSAEAARVGRRFDLLVGLSVGVALLSLGVMAAFALTWLPAWAAFDRASHWRAALWTAAAIGSVAYIAAFALALVADQPFGPVCVLVTLALALVYRWAAASRPGAGASRTR